jgi:hypothetical protein
MVNKATQFWGEGQHPASLAGKTSRGRPAAGARGMPTVRPLSINNFQKQLEGLLYGKAKGSEFSVTITPIHSRYEPNDLTRTQRSISCKGLNFASAKA